MNNTRNTITWDELLASLDTAESHPLDAAWNICRYLNDNLRQLDSHQARSLLAICINLPVGRPSQVYSFMLSIAVKMSAQFSDFNLPKFLQMWGYEQNLRPEDRQRQHGSDGRTYPALSDKVEKARQQYALRHHTGETLPGCEILQMYAVKVFERAAGTRKLRLVRLVAPSGEELSAEASLFPCRPYEIQGRLFDVLTRLSKQGNKRAAEIVLSYRRIEDAFPVVAGYVDGIDESRGHYHVYDALSRHFVAEKPRQAVRSGDFVEFSPIIPRADNFKSAAVIRTLSPAEGSEKFGLLDAEVTYLNTVDGYLRYRLTAAPAPTDEGTVSAEGFAPLASVAGKQLLESLSVGSRLRLLLFLKRGKDGEKRNHVARIF